MIATGCPLGDASSFLVRVGEYARVSVVFQFIFYCTARIFWNVKGTVLHIWVWVVAFGHVVFTTFSRCSLLSFCHHLLYAVLQNPTSNYCWIYMIPECLQCFRVIAFFFMPGARCNWKGRLLQNLPLRWYVQTQQLRQPGLRSTKAVQSERQNQKWVEVLRKWPVTEGQSLRSQILATCSKNIQLMPNAGKHVTSGNAGKVTWIQLFSLIG